MLNPRKEINIKMREKIYVLFLYIAVISYAAQSPAQEQFIQDRLQLEGSFATTFDDDAGFNIGLNYAPPLPGVLDRNLTIGGFWQWTFEVDNPEGDRNIMKLGEEIRLQTAFGSFVPYVKFETAWIRFDDGRTIDKLGIGPGAGFSFFLSRNLSLGAEANTSFIIDSDEAPDDQITTLLLGPRILF